MKKLLIILSALSYVVTGKAAFPHEMVLAHIKRNLQSYTMDYTMSFSQGSKAPIMIVGTMAVDKGRMYDSSNARFLLLNETWYLVADHLTEYVSVAHIPTLNRQTGELGNFSPLEFMYNEDAFYRNVRVIAGSDSANTIWYDVRIEGNPSVKKLSVCLDKTTWNVVAYHLLVNYPLDADGAELRLATIEMRGSRFRAVDRNLFDHRRVIAETSKTAKLRRYNHYKTLLSTGNF